MGLFSDYKRKERARLEPGDYRLVVTNAEESVSKSSGNPMLVIEVQPNGFNINIKHYISKNQYFDENVTDFLDSFGIEEGDFEMLGWIGAMGAGKLVEDGDYMKVRYFLSPKKAEGLPAWQGEKPERNTITTFSDDAGDEEELPFI